MLAASCSAFQLTTAGAAINPRAMTLDAVNSVKRTSS